jgi:cholesterol oxidase
MLAGNWEKRRGNYDFAVVGSGYGGAILAARISSASLTSQKTICLLEQGKEWPVGTFPDSLAKVSGAVRHPFINPLGLYEFLPFEDISVIQGSGLGGTSLINANVAIVPDDEVFHELSWPRTVTSDELMPYYERAANMLEARTHPRAAELLKVKALDRRAREIGRKAEALNIAVNFHLEGTNAYGAQQTPCIDCGDCVTGCNVGAKNTLCMNYLPLAKNNGADIFTQTEVDWLEKLADGGWRIHGGRFTGLGLPENFTLEARCVILSAGSLGTTEILLRSRLHGLPLSPRVGSGFTGNADFFGISYNSDYQTNVLGFGNDPNHPWRANAPGPTIVGGVRYNTGISLHERITVEDLSFPKAFVSSVMIALGAMAGEDTDVGDKRDELARRLRNNPLAPYQAHNAMNHTMLYLVMGFDDAKGTLSLKTDLLNPNGTLQIDWEDAGSQSVFSRMNEEIRHHARALGAHFISDPLWKFFNLRKLVTAHPLGGCAMGEDYLQGAVDEFGRVFAADGRVHEGLVVADGSLIPSALGVNPFLTISALSERIADRLVRSIKGESYPTRPFQVAVPEINPVEGVKS